MSKTRILFAAVLLFGVMNSASACEDVTKAACGACGEVSKGDATISGDARLDGFFKAVGQLGISTGSIKAGFNADVEELAAVFMTQAEIDASADLVADLKAKIEGEISANVEGGLSVKYQPPKCSANVSVAVDAQAQCEAKAGCEVSAECDPGSVSVKCEGSCSGGCSGGCEGKLECKAELSASGTCEGSCSGTCEVTAPSATCEGTCTGGCEVSASGTCEGTCKGTCSGNCSATDGNGDCAGECDGDCSGTCEVNVQGECSGSCEGKCEFDPGEAQCEGTCKGECTAEVTAEADCEGEVKCEGSCTGECSGGCEGNVEPPSCSAEGSCEASADCQASASAQGSASLECTPPSLEVAFEMKAGVNAQAKAEFLGKMEVFKVKMIGILKGFAELKALVQGNAELGIQPPAVTLKASIEGLISAGFGEFDIAAGLLPCVLPAFQESVEILVSIPTDMAVVLKGQADLAAIII